MKKLPVIILFLSLGMMIQAQSRGENYDESKVPAFTLPDPLICKNGEKIKTVKQWETIRRPEIMTLFSTEMYGVTPRETIPVEYQLIKIKKDALNGKATSQQNYYFIRQMR